MNWYLVARFLGVLTTMLHCIWQWGLMLHISLKYPQNKHEVCLVLPPEYLRGIRFRALAPSVQPGELD